MGCYSGKNERAKCLDGRVKLLQEPCQLSVQSWLSMGLPNLHYIVALSGTLYTIQTHVSLTVFGPFIVSILEKYLSPGLPHDQEIE